MSLEAILAGIEAAAEAELGRLQQESESHVQEILSKAHHEAASQCQEARQTVLRSIAAERARRLYAARLEAEGITAAAREEGMSQIVDEVRHRLSCVRDEPAYAGLLHRLVKEAASALGENEVSLQATNGQRAQIAIDPRDEGLLPAILQDLSLDLVIKPTLNSWGGAIIGSADGRIIINNTLESRLERAAPYFQFTEKCPILTMVMPAYTP